MFPKRKPQPNEVVGAELSQEALCRLHEFHAAWIAGRPGGRRAMLRDCSLAARDLSHMDFTEAVLLDCDFSGIAARDTKFTGAILTNARFDRADLAGADFVGADLGGASLRLTQLDDTLRRLDVAQVAEMVMRHGIWIASAGAQGKRADFSGADLSAVDLSGRNLCLADFTGAMLASTQLKGALLIAADFRDANLTRANLVEADIRGANFADAYCRDLDLTDARIGMVPGLPLATRGL